MGSGVVTDKDDEIDAILADTNELQTDWTNGGRLDTILDAVKTDTTTIAANTGKIVYGSVSSTSGIKQSIQTGSATGFVSDEKEL